MMLWLLCERITNPSLNTALNFQTLKLQRITFVIGRKNWLFSNTSRGANASAILYSFVETAKANGLLVDSYLQTCLNELAKKPESLEHLLPWNIKQG